MELDPDFADLLRAFADADTRYLVVGGYAVAYHATPRFTRDLDLWVEDSAQNLERVRQALVAFGAPPVLIDRLQEAGPDDVLWMGTPPLRADIMKGVPGGDFTRSYASRVETTWAGVPVRIIGLEELIRIKRASGRPQDLADADVLERRRGAT